MKISAVLLARNEERRILEVHLKNLAEFCDEIIVVVDVDSSDNTYQICKNYTDKVYKYKYNIAGLLAEGRRYGSQFVSNEWELWDDADFLYPKEFQNELLDAIKSPFNYVAVEIELLDYYFGKWFKKTGGSKQKRFLYKKYASANFIDIHKIEYSINGKVYVAKNKVLHYGHANLNYFVNNLNKYTSQSINFQHIVKKRSKESLLKSLIGRPVHIFLVYFFRCKFFREGWHGFILSILLAFYNFLETAKIYEYNFPREGIDDYKV